MKRKAYILLLLLAALPLAASAQQKYFYYVRYNPAEGSPYDIVKEIDRAARRAPQRLLVMVSGGAHPIVATEENWAAQRERIILQQNAPDVYTDVEEQILDSLFTKELKEYVSQRGGTLQIEGSNDRQWQVTFIMSQAAFENEEEYEFVPLEWTLINQLPQRDVELRWINYDTDGHLHEQEIPRHHFYSFD